jgi:hypothetical protein
MRPPPSRHLDDRGHRAWAGSLSITAILMLSITVGWFYFERYDTGSKNKTPGFTQLRLPSGACPHPEVGQVLIITVFSGEDGKPARARCQLVTGRTI